MISMSFKDYNHSLKKTDSIEQLNEVLRKFLASFSINTFAFTYYAYYPHSNNPLKFDYCSDNFKSWHQHYHEQNYDGLDSTMDNVRKTVLPTAWNLKDQLREAKSARERQMRIDSIEFGAERGICIPLYGPKEDFAVLLLVQMQGENCSSTWDSHHPEIFTASYYYYAHLQQHLLINPKENDQCILKKRELQCLQLIAHNYSVAQIAKTLHITERTVNFHIQRLNKKLGTTNKYKSLLKAMKDGLIAP